MSCVGVPQADLRWLAAALPFGAAVLGMVAVVSPLAAVVLTGALAFTAVAFHDLAAGVAFFTVITFIETLPGVAGSQLGAVKAAGIVLVLAALRRSGTPLLLKDHPAIAFVVVAFAAWAIASATWAYDDGRAVGHGVRLALGATLVFVVFAAVKQARHARWIVAGYIAGAAASAVVGFFGPTYAAAADRLGGGLGDPNFLAAMLVPAIVFSAFALSWTERALERSLLLGCMLLLVASLFQTQSRGGIVAMAVALVAALIFGGPVRGRFVALLGVLVTTGVVYYTLFASAEATSRLTSPGEGTGRTDLWTIATGVVSDHPLLGVGAGNFPLVMPEYASHTINLSSIHLVVDRPQVVHNTYLGVLAELGIVGLVAFALVLMGSLVLVWRASTLFARVGDTSLELVSRAVLVGLAGMLAAFVFLSGETEKPLWLLIGLAVALHALARRAAATYERR